MCASRVGSNRGRWSAAATAGLPSHSSTQRLLGAHTGALQQPTSPAFGSVTARATGPIATLPPEPPPVGAPPHEGGGQDGLLSPAASEASPASPKDAEAVPTSPAALEAAPASIPADGERHRTKSTRTAPGLAALKACMSLLSWADHW
eukprot:scaffold1926_cov122-Isochrysis_galbana.AAC.1